MKLSTYPEPDARLARLADTVGLPAVWPPTGAFLGELAERTRLHAHDLLLVADLPVPDEAWLFDERAGVSSSLVSRSLGLPPPARRLLRARARSLTAPADTLGPWQPRTYERYPPGFGALLVRMLALRNLNWSRAAKAICLMSGVCKAAATVGAVGHGTKPLDAELLGGFAATLGVPVGVLAGLTGVRPTADGPDLAPEVRDTAGLVWEVRHLNQDQERWVTAYAGELTRGSS